MVGERRHLIYLAAQRAATGGYHRLLCATGGDMQPRHKHICSALHPYGLSESLLLLCNELNTYFQALFYPARLRRDLRFACGCCRGMESPCIRPASRKQDQLPLKGRRRVMLDAYAMRRTAPMLLVLLARASFVCGMLESYSNHISERQ